jgi:hypothetical protein
MEVIKMKKEPVNSVNEKPIYTQFTCPDCGGHTLRSVVETYATITGFGDEAVFYVLDDEEKQYHEIAYFFCSNFCNWDSDKESEVRDYVK